MLTAVLERVVLTAIPIDMLICIAFDGIGLTNAICTSFVGFALVEIPARCICATVIVRRFGVDACGTAAHLTFGIAGQRLANAIGATFAGIALVEIPAGSICAAVFVRRFGIDACAVAFHLTGDITVIIGFADAIVARFVGFALVEIPARIICTAVIVRRFGIDAGAVAIDLTGDIACIAIGLADAIDALFIGFAFIVIPARIICAAVIIRSLGIDANTIAFDLTCNTACVTDVLYANAISARFEAFALVEIIARIICTAEIIRCFGVDANVAAFDLAGSRALFRLAHANATHAMLVADTFVKTAAAAVCTAIIVRNTRIDALTIAHHIRRITAESIGTGIG